MHRPLASYHKWIDREIRKKKYGKQPVSLYEPIEYLMSLGGKRLRPMLTLLSYALFKDDVESIVKYAVAVEAFHNFTLMHDDIMDRAPLRRGKMTVHKKWNVNTAILSGDVMLVKVYEMFMDLEPAVLQEVLQSFNACATAVCEGQQWDMEFETSRQVSEEQYLEMIRLKTAVLLGFSLELGAILANAAPASRKLLREFGIAIGIGFQLKDDLLDAYADPVKFGKQIGGDIIANKKTYLLIKASEKSSGKKRTELHGWLAARKFNKKEKITAIKKIYDALGIPVLTEKKINYFFRKGFKNLMQLNCDAGQKATLLEFTEALVGRQS
jgi:geranylgeranyl diphosphate synthase, type II